MQYFIKKTNQNFVSRKSPPLNILMAFILLNTKYILHSNPQIFDPLTNTCNNDVRIKNSSTTWKHLRKFY